MEFWDIIIVLLCGALGGVCNCFLTERGLTQPWITLVDGGKKHWEPGALGIIFLGIVASAIYFGFVGSPEFSLWKKIAICLSAGIGGGSLITTLLQQQQIQLQQNKIHFFNSLTKQVVQKFQSE